MIPIDQKEKAILQFLFEDGYAKKRAIADHLDNLGLDGVSEANIQRILTNLQNHNIIAHKELAYKFHVYFIDDRGLEVMGKEKADAQQYKTRLSRIQKQHLEHYFLVRNLEKMLQKNTENTPYFFESMNEFNTDGSLNLKDFRIKSDAQFKFFKGKYKRLALRVEMDTGVESIKTQIKEKFDRYAKYLRSSSISKEYETFPVYILFVTPLNRIDTILQKLGKHEIMPYILFMAIEHLQQFQLDQKFIDELNKKKLISEIRNKIKKGGKHQISRDNSFVEVLEKNKKWQIKDTEYQVEYIVKMVKKGSPLITTEIKNIFSLEIIYDHNKKNLSLLSIIQKREPLLQICNAVTEASSIQPNYEFIPRTVYSSGNDPSFPIPLETTLGTEMWQPHGYMKIKKILPDNRFRDTLFVLIFSVSNTVQTVESELPLYDIFLQQKHSIERVVEWPVSYGLLVIAENQQQITNIFDTLEKYKIAKRTRVILLSDCTPKKILQEPVWLTETGSYISLFPSENKTN